MSIAEKFEVLADRVYEKGKKDEYDSFWNAFQRDGTAYINYSNLGMCPLWNDTTFTPKHPIKFANNDYSASSAFNGTAIKNIEVDVDASKCPMLSTTFAYSASLNKISNLIVGQQTVFKNTFAGSKNIETLIISGTIGQNGFDVSSCTLLSLDSLLSIINALANYKDDTSTTQWVCTLGSTNLAKLTEAQIAIATEKGWSLV